MDRDQKLDHVIERLERGETVYLLNDVEGIAVRMLIDDNLRCFARFSGCEEYPIATTTNIVTGAWLELNEMSKENYDNY